MARFSSRGRHIAAPSPSLLPAANPISATGHMRREPSGHPGSSQVFPSIPEYYLIFHFPCPAFPAPSASPMPATRTTVPKRRPPRVYRTLAEGVIAGLWGPFRGWAKYTGPETVETTSSCRRSGPHKPRNTIRPLSRTHPGHRENRRNKPFSLEPPRNRRVFPRGNRRPGHTRKHRRENTEKTMVRPAYKNHRFRGENAPKMYANRTTVIVAAPSRRRHSHRRHTPAYAVTKAPCTRSRG